jgi:hypothetical protein
MRLFNVPMISKTQNQVPARKTLMAVRAFGADKIAKTSWRSRKKS